MNMQLWNPLQEFENLLHKYGHHGELAKSGENDFTFADWAPTVDIAEEDDRYLIKADVPGVDKKDIEVSLDNGLLSIRGEKRMQKETGKGTRQHRSERFHGTFARSFSLPAAVKSDKVDASYKDGVLSLVIPKAEDAKAKKIDIKVQ